MTGSVCVPAPYANVEAADDAVLLWGEIAMLYVGPQVIEPPQPAALATPLQPCMQFHESVNHRSHTHKHS